MKYQHHWLEIGLEPGSMIAIANSQVESTMILRNVENYSPDKTSHLNRISIFRNTHVKPSN
jgi:hypothetical protein